MVFSTLMLTPMQYHVSHHAMQRLQERFPEIHAQYSGMHSKDIIQELLEQSHENRSFINNTKRMIFLYEKYGFDKVYRFMEIAQKNMVMVFVKNPDKNDFVLSTVINFDLSQYKKVSLQQKKWRQARAVEQQQEMMEEQIQFLSQLQSLEPIPVPEKKERAKVNKNPKKQQEQLPSIIVQLKQAMEQGKSRRLQKLGDNQSLREIIMDDKRYVFLYDHGNIELKMEQPYIEQSTPANEVELNILPEGQLKEKILDLIFREKTTIVETVSNRITIHHAIVGDTRYHFRAIKTRPGERTIELLGDPVIIAIEELLAME